jgi:1-acyl-sn-glycerol-3-phosphate acyltransferase
MQFRHYLRATAKLTRLVSVTTAFTIATNLRARNLSESERWHYRAERQTEGCKILCRIMDVRVRCEGDVEADGMVVSNHFGILDPLVLATAMPMAFVAKAEIEKWPFVGWVTRAMGVFFVHRNRSARTTDFVDQVRDRIEAGVRVTVFPEGTTSQRPEVQPFKTGAFAAVADREIRITPVHLSVVTVDGRPLDDEGRDKVVWAESPRSFMEQFMLLLSMEEATFQIRIGAPVSARGLGRKELATVLRERVSELA